MVSEDAANIIRPELLPDEELLWADRPRKAPTAIYYWGAFIVLFFFILFIGPISYALFSGDAAIFSYYNLSINGERVTPDTPVATLWTPLIMTIVMMLFFFAFGAGWLLTKMREVYAVTDQRVIIVSRFPKRRVSSVNPAMTPYIERNGDQNIGSLSFRGAEHGLVDKILAFYRIRLQSFMNVQNPKEVEALIFNRFIQGHKKGPF